jgi:hypothetical protein
MKTILTALGTASLLALTACGGGAGSEANNAAATADDVTLPADENLALPADTLGNEANALETTNSVDANFGADANLTGNTTDAGTTSGNAIGNVTGNTQ